MTLSYVSHHSFTCAIWLLQKCNMIPSYVPTRRSVYYVWHVFFIPLTYIFHMCNMTPSYLWHNSLNLTCHLNKFNMYLHICDKTPLYVCETWLLYMCHPVRGAYHLIFDPFRYVTWLLHRRHPVGGFRPHIGLFCRYVGLCCGTHPNAHTHTEMKTSLARIYKTEF